jgi:hypothetical protein
MEAKKRKIGSVTIDKLAQMMQRGFAELREDVSGDLSGLKTEMREGFKQSEERDLTLAKRLDGVVADIRDIKLNVRSLVRCDNEQELEINELRSRVGRVEKKIGLEV